jgi:hypothetical protein
VYFLSRLDNSDLDSIFSDIFSSEIPKLFDKEDEPIGDEFKAVIKSVQSDSWEPQIFIDWFNKQQNYGMTAKLTF